MGLAAAGAGASEGLDIYLTRLLEQAKMEQAARHAAETLAETSRHNLSIEGINREAHNLNKQEADARVQENTRNHNLLAAGRAQDDARDMANTIPADTFLPTEDPAVKKLREGGFGSILKVQDPTLGSVQTAGGVTLPGASKPSSVGATSNSPGKQAGFIKLRSFTQQQEFDKDKRERDAEAERRRHDIAMENKPQRQPDPQPQMLYGQDGKLHAVQFSGGKVTELPVPDGLSKSDPTAIDGPTKTMMNGAKMLRPHVQDLLADAEALEKRGLFGPVMSRVREAMAKAGTSLDSADPDEAARGYQRFSDELSKDPELNNDRLVGKFAADLGLMATGAGRVHGGARGGGSAQMLEHFKGLLSSNGTLSMFQGRMDALDGYLKRYAEGPKGASPAKEDSGQADYVYDPKTKKLVKAGG